MKEAHEEISERIERAPRLVDGIVTEASRARGLSRARGRETWLLVARHDEPVEEFFLDSPFGAGDRTAGDDPVAWICRGVRPDGTLRLGFVDFDVDRFASDVLGAGGRGPGK